MNIAQDMTLAMCAVATPQQNYSSLANGPHRTDSVQGEDHSPLLRFLRLDFPPLSSIFKLFLNMMA